jgi:hypothetical protein
MKAFSPPAREGSMKVLKENVLPIKGTNGKLSA